MASVPIGTVTFRNVRHDDLMFPSDEACSGSSRPAAVRKETDDTADAAARPADPRAVHWNIVRGEGDAFCVQSVLTRGWLKAGPWAQRWDSSRRRVFVSEADTRCNLAYQWHIVPRGRCFALKNARYDEWMYANGPVLPNSKQPCVLTWIPGEANHKTDSASQWVIELAGTPSSNVPRSLSPSSQRGPVPGKHVRIESAGFLAGNRAAFFLDGEPLAFQTCRGLNVVVLDPGSLDVLWQRGYDVYASHGERNQFAEDIHGLPEGSIVLAAAQDSGMDQLGAGEKRALQSLGASFAGGGEREGYALIARKGGRVEAEILGKAVAAAAHLHVVTSAVPPPVTLKIQHDGSCYRVHLPAAAQLQQFADFERFIASAVGHSLGGMQPSYMDDEGDWCTINSTATLAAFLEDAIRRHRVAGGVVKLNVKGSVLPPSARSSAWDLGSAAPSAGEAGEAGAPVDELVLVDERVP